MMEDSTRERKRSQVPISAPLSMVFIAAVLAATGCLGAGATGALEKPVAFSTPTARTSATEEAVVAENVPSATPPQTGEHLLADTPTVEETPVGPGSTPTFTAPPSQPSRPVEGSRAPGLALRDLTGNEVSLRGLRGKPVLLNFWASW
jgi:hypothetical protein